MSYRPLYAPELETSQQLRKMGVIIPTLARRKRGFREAGDLEDCTISRQQKQDAKPAPGILLKCLRPSIPTQRPVSPEDCKSYSWSHWSKTFDNVNNSKRGHH